MGRSSKSNLNFKPEAPASFVSLILFGAEVVTLIGCYIASVVIHGQAGVVLGIVLLGAAVAAIAGIVTAINAIMKPDKSHSLAFTGLILNILFLLLEIGLYILGAAQYGGPIVQ